MTDDRSRTARNPDSVGAAGRRPAAPPRRKRARQEIASAGEPSARFQEPASARGRRLSDAERRAIQERRRQKRAPAGPTTARRRQPMASVPGTSRGLLVVGALLIGGLAVLAFGGGRLFGSAREDRPRGTTVAGGGAATPGALALAGTGQFAAAGVEAPPSSPVANDRAPAATNRRDGQPVVCIDPGHGGSDRGFVRQDDGVVGRMEEAPLTLEQAWDLEARLQQQGIEVVMTREDDVEVNAARADVNGDGKTAKDDKPGTNFFKNLDELQARINVCNAANADLLVSMHVNGVPLNPGVAGYETWYTAAREFGDVNARFATLAFRALGEQMEAVGYAATPREVNDDRLANVEPEHGGSTLKHMIVTGPAVPGMVTPSAMPGAIVEALFITNDDDARFLGSSLGRNAIVSGYEQAVLQFFEEFPG